MKPLQCSHCGKKIYTGFLCSDCQALKNYQPHLFAGNYVNGNGELNVDRATVTKFASIVALAVFAAIFYPYVRKLATAPRTAKADTANSIVNDFKQKFDTSKYTNELGTSDSNASNSAAQAQPNFAVTTRPTSPPPPQPSYYSSLRPPSFNSSPTYPRTNFVAASGNGMGGTYDTAIESKSTINQFLQGYCMSRYQSTGQSVSVVGISWLPGGSGASVGISEGGLYTQGTAQFAPGFGWSWLTSPEPR